MCASQLCSSLPPSGMLANFFKDHNWEGCANTPATASGLQQQLGKNPNRLLTFLSLRHRTWQGDEWSAGDLKLRTAVHFGHAGPHSSIPRKWLQAAASSSGKQPVVRGCQLLIISTINYRHDVILPIYLEGMLYVVYSWLHGQEVQTVPNQGSIQGKDMHGSSNPKTILYWQLLAYYAAQLLPRHMPTVAEKSHNLPQQAKAPLTVQGCKHPLTSTSHWTKWEPFCIN